MSEETNNLLGRLTEFENLTPEELEQVRQHFVFPFWVHKVVLFNKTTFYVNHSPTLPFFPFPYVTFPNNNLGTTIEDIESALPALGAIDDSGWIIERRYGTAADRDFKIHHTPGVTDKCPRSGSYAKLADIAKNKHLSVMHNTNTTTPTCECDAT